MPFWCIDPTNGVDGAQGGQATQALAEASPYQTPDAIWAALPAAGDSILFQGGDLVKGGHTLASTLNGTSGNPIIIGSYGTGRGGFDADGALNALVIKDNLYITLRNIELTGGKFSTPSNSATLLITATSNPPHLTSVYAVVDRCDIHDPEPNDTSGDGAGIDVRASNVEVFDTEVYNCPDDGIYNEGDNCEFHHNNIHDVNQHPVVKGGDCLKFSSNGSCLNCHSHHNIHDHSNDGRKQALIMAGPDAGQIGEHDKCMGSQISLSLKAGSSAIARRQLCEPVSISGIETETAGLKIEGSGKTVESVIVNPRSGNKPTYGIWIGGNVTAMQGTVIYCDLGPSSGDTAALIRVQAGYTIDAIRNSIIGGNTDPLGYTLYIPNTTTLTECDYNIYVGEDAEFRAFYKNVTYTSFTSWKDTNPDGHDANSTLITDVDVLFRDAANGDFRLNNGQEILGAQIGYKDFLGHRNFPTVIGAYNPDTVTDRGSPTDRGAPTYRGAPTNRGVKDTKYPNWGIRT